MVKWIFCLLVVHVFTSCQSEKSTKTKEQNGLPTNIEKQSGTAANVTVPLIFLLKENEILHGGGSMKIRDTAFFRSLPVGVYPMEKDTILFGEMPKTWIWSGVMRWPEGGRVALADFTIISGKPLLNQKIGIFPQRPGKDGYLPGCFNCPGWMRSKYGELAIFWEQNFQ